MRVFYPFTVLQLSHVFERLVEIARRQRRRRAAPFAFPVGQQFAIWDNYHFMSILLRINILVYYVHEN